MADRVINKHVREEMKAEAERHESQLRAGLLPEAWAAALDQDAAIELEAHLALRRARAQSEANVLVRNKWRKMINRTDFTQPLTERLATVLKEYENVPWFLQLLLSADAQMKLVALRSKQRKALLGHKAEKKAVGEKLAIHIAEGGSLNESFMATYPVAFSAEHAKRLLKNRS